MKIVLASASPRRRELLQMLGLSGFSVIPAQSGEADCRGLSPEDAVTALSRAKAAEVAADCAPDDIIIAADTIVWHEGEILGKPDNEAGAAKMLGRLSGCRHEVYTGICIISGGTQLCEFEKTSVLFREIAPREIAKYVATGEPLDKAGAYGAQGLGSLFVERIDGDFFNVMGLPLCRLGKMLGSFGVSIL